MESRIAFHNGSPTLFVDGKPVYPLFYYYETAKPRELTRRMIRAFAERGIHLYTSYVHHGWNGPGQYDPTEPGPEWPKDRLLIDELMRELLDVDPEALYMPRFQLKSAKWWMETYPEERELWSDGHRDTASYASEVWLQGAREATERFVAHTQAQDYADRIVGYHVCAGDSCEWSNFACMNGDIFDYSGPMRRFFRSWLREKYNGDTEALRDAWKDGSVTFETAEVPSEKQQLSTDFWHFRDPSKGVRVADFLECLVDAEVRDVVGLCESAKCACDDRVIAGVFYGYLLTMAWPGRMFAPQGFRTFDLSAIQRSGHMGLMKVLASPYVDFLASPYDYAWRSVGGEGSFMSLVATIHRHGKLYLLEDDTRTHLHPDERYGKVDTAEDSVAVLKRNFCNYLTGNAGFWWMEQGRDFSWFDDPQILDCQGKINEIAQRSLARDRSPSGEIAVIFDEQSLFHHTYRKDLMFPLIYKFKLFGLPRLGAPVRFYHFDDLADDDFPDHKLYIFLDLFYVTPERIERVHRRVRRGGAVSAWFYGAGLVSPNGISTDTMERLTGIRFGMDDVKWELTCALTNWDHPITEGLPADLSFGTDNFVGPILRVDDPDATVLGRLIYNEGRSRPGLAVKEFDGWSSVYVGAPNPPASLLRGIARFAGVHIYSDANDVLHADRHFLGVHSIQGGWRTFRLPEVTDVWEVFEGRKVASQARSFRQKLPRRSTRLYFLGNWPSLR